MTHHVVESISAYIDNELTDDDRKQVEAHLMTCPECRGIFNDIIQLQIGIASMFASIEVPDQLDDHVMQAIGEGATDRKHNYWPFVPVFGALLIVAIVFAIVGSFIIKLGSITLKVLYSLLVSFGSILGSEPYIALGLIGFSLLLIIGSAVSLRLLVKTKNI
jgi:anti-sigma factor RsiW